MHFRGFSIFKIICFLLLIPAVFTSGFAGSSGLTVLSMPGSSVSGWNTDRGLFISDAVYTPVFIREERTFSASYTHWMFDTPYTQISGGNRKFFAGFSGLSTDGIEIRTEIPSDDPIGETGYYNGNFYAGREFILPSGIHIGFSGHFLLERLYHASAAGLALNGAAGYRFSDVFSITAGFRNLGKMQELYHSDTALPADYYASFQTCYRNISAVLSLHGDRDGELYGVWGLSGGFQDLVSAGFSYNGTNSSWHLGAALHYRKLTVGYGQFFLRDQLAAPAMIEIGFRI